MRAGDLAMVVAVVRLPDGELRATVLRPATGWFTLQVSMY
jgi:hypothetical protein